MTTLVITGRLRARTALHIGGGQSSSEADALLRRNGAGEVCIPGSAVAGSLRAVVTRLAPRLGGGVCKSLQSTEEVKERNKVEHDERGKQTACNCAACHLFGAMDPQEQNEGTKGGRAARLWVYDARLVEQPLTAIRDGVGIDRRTGAAARLEAVKFDLEVLPAGAVFDMRLELEDAAAQDEALLVAALAEWQAGRGSVGGRVARGLGAFDFVDVKCYLRNLDDETALMAYLRSDEPVARLDEIPGWMSSRLEEARRSIKAEAISPYAARGWVEVEFTLQASGPFLAGDVTAAQRAGFDHAPLVEGRPVLPGASLRGVLRSHAERIARTLATRWAQDSTGFLQCCPACSPVARPRDNDDRVPLQCCDSLLAKPADEETEEDELCLSCRLFGSTGMGSRLIVEDSPLKAGTEPQYKVQDFLAIDRFTGGGREGAKFDAAVLWRPAFSARLKLENPRDWELGWLALLLRDLAEGWLTIGFGRAKGLGQVTVPEWTVRFGFLDPSDFPGKAARIKAISHIVSSVYQVLELRGNTSRQGDRITWSLSNGVSEVDWVDEMDSWVQAFAGRIRGFRREALPILSEDTYFDRRVLGMPMVEVYPRKVRLDGRP